VWGGLVENETIDVVVTTVDWIVFSGLTIGTLFAIWGFIIALLDRLETGA
jgi:hypothetical protein